MSEANQVVDPSGHPAGRPARFAASPNVGDASDRRREALPAAAWLAILCAAGLAHPFLPNYNQVITHVFALGVLANAALLWSRALTDRWKGHSQSRAVSGFSRLLPDQALLNAAVLATVSADATEGWAYRGLLAQTGAAFLALLALWQASSLSATLLSRRALPSRARLKGGALALGAAWCCLAAGALCAGAVTLQISDAARESFALAGRAVGLGGFLGLAGLSALIALRFAPRQPRRGGPARREGPARRRQSFARASVPAALCWFAFALGLLVFGLVRDGRQAEFPTAVFLVGFAAQGLCGLLSYLVAAAPRGGRLAEASGVFRLVLLNLALAVWQLADNSYLKILASFACVGVLIATVVLLFCAELSNQRERDAGAPSTASSNAATPGGGAGQAALAVAIVALAVACFGGLGSRPTTEPGAAGGTVSDSAGGTPSDTEEVDVIAGEYEFVPSTIEVAPGTHVVLNLKNKDSMVHDLAMENGATSGRLKPGQSTRVDLGVINQDAEGWCTIAGHRTRGMTLSIRILDAAP